MMDDEYVIEEFSEDENDCSSSSEDELQEFIKRECGLVEVEDDFEAEVDKVMTAHLNKLKSSEDNDSVEMPNTSKASASLDDAEKQRQINDELLYDPDMDDDDEKWINEKRRSYIFPCDKNKNSNVEAKPLPNSDAVLNCPACLSLLCLDCQRHEIYKSQYRAMFVSNCNIISEEILKYPNKKKLSKKQKKDTISDAMDTYNPVRCSVCNTEVAVYDNNEIYHFFNVLASY